MRYNRLGVNEMEIKREIKSRINSQDEKTMIKKMQMKSSDNEEII